MSARINDELAPTYEQLKAERDALAVENAALKKSEVEFDEYCRIECEDKGGEWVSDFTETPATDAALAAIEARGVEKFAQRMQEKMEGLDPIKLPAYAEEIDHLISQLYAFATELREAK